MSSGMRSWDSGDIEQGEKDLLRALSRARNHRGKYEVAVSLYTLGSRYNHIDQFQKGVQMLEEALSIQKEIKSNDKVFTGRIIGELMLGYYVLGLTDKDYYKRAKPHLLELKDLSSLFKGGKPKKTLKSIFEKYSEKYAELNDKEMSELLKKHYETM